MSLDQSNQNRNAPHTMPTLIPAQRTPTAALATAERDAIVALSEYLCTPEGASAGTGDIDMWLFERGWPTTKRKRWLEIIAAQQAMQTTKPGDPGDPALILHRLDHRLERLAHAAEDRQDMKHAIQATEAQAKLHRLGGYAPASTNNMLTLNVTNATAHLVSDDDLARIAATVDATVVATETNADIDDLTA